MKSPKQRSTPSPQGLQRRLRDRIEDLRRRPADGWFDPLREPAVNHFQRTNRPRRRFAVIAGRSPLPESVSSAPWPSVDRIFELLHQTVVR